MDQNEFQHMEEVSFPVLVSPANTKRKETPGSRKMLRVTINRVISVEL